MMQIIILKNKALYFSLGFLFLTIFGTLHHELGHIIVAKILKYNTTLHYSSMEWNNDFKENVMKFYLKNQSIIEERKPFSNSHQYYKNLDKIEHDEFLIVLGGVLFTVVTATGAFILLIFYVKRNITNIPFWSLVFLSMFWSRQIFNLLKGVLQIFLKKSNSFFWGDEQKLSVYLNLYKATLSISLGLLGLIVVALILFKIIPLKDRFSFIIAAFTGSLLGYVLWMFVVGPLILP